MKTKWYEKKRVYIPLSIVLGLLGFDILYGSLSTKKEDEIFDSEDDSHKDTLFFRKKSDLKNSFSVFLFVIYIKNILL